MNKYWAAILVRIQTLKPSFRINVITYTGGLSFLVHCVHSFIQLWFIQIQFLRASCVPGAVGGLGIS